MTLTCTHWREAGLSNGGLCKSGKYAGRTIDLGICGRCTQRQPDESRPIQPRIPMRISTGAGDDLKRLFDAIGVGTIAKWYEAITGKQCGCPLRQRWLNRRFPRVAGFFERVVVISLARTPERLSAFGERAMKVQWPFAEPLTFNAIDGQGITVPPYWTIGGPGFGCLQSHIRVIKQAIATDVQRLLVFEDDAGIAGNAGSVLKRVLKALPYDWDQLMIGGQQMRDGTSTPITPDLARVTQCERTHAYALSANGMRSLLAWWNRGVDGHCDWQMGDWQALPDVRAYAITPFIAYQAANFSTLTARHEPERMWNG